MVDRITQQSNTPQNGRTQTPWPVKVISIMDWIGGMSFLVLGIGFMFLGRFIINEVGGILGFVGEYSVLGGGILAIAGVALIVVGVGLWKGMNWARIIEIMVAALFVAVALVGLVQWKSVFVNTINAVANGFIAGYLLFSSRVKAAFAT